MKRLQPDHHLDSALQVAIESMQEIVSRGQDVEEYASKTLATLRFLVRQLASSSQVTSTQASQLQRLVVLLETLPSSS